MNINPFNDEGFKKYHNNQEHRNELEQKGLDRIIDSEFMQIYQLRRKIQLRNHYPEIREHLKLHKGELRNCLITSWNSWKTVFCFMTQTNSNRIQNVEDEYAECKGLGDEAFLSCFHQKMTKYVLKFVDTLESDGIEPELKILQKQQQNLEQK